MKHSAMKLMILSTSSILAILSTGTQAAYADECGQTSLYCSSETGEDERTVGSVVEHKAAPNTEGDVLQTTSSIPAFSISVDGNRQNGSDKYEDKQRQTDVALEGAEVQIKFDGLEVQPRLNVGTDNSAVAIVRSKGTHFHSFWNYGAFIESAEIRLFEADQSVKGTPLSVLPIIDGQPVALKNNAELPDELIYVLRVTDKNGRFDETTAKPLSLLDEEIDEADPDAEDKTLAGYAVDRTAVRNIQIKGGSITVFGKNVPAESRASVMGRQVPIDENGKFLAQTILPFGQQSVTVNLQSSGHTASFEREIHINDTEFFYVAIGDLTLGTQNSDGPADFLAASDEDFDDVYVNGRGAMYLKGRINGEYLITGAIDTGEDRIKDLFKNLDEKNPRQLLRRLDADRIYPVYGDDSTLVEDAPTQGRIYVRVEKNDSHIMFGNFATQITGTEFAHLDRGLYGGIADYNSIETTEFGDRVTQITAFAADPGTIPARDEFRATGGSVYFLERQDLSIGSERLRVEIRDKVSGLVLETRDLRPQEDYDIDYIQGRVLLSDPLQSTARDEQLVRDGALSGNDVFLVARYEYTPSLSDVSGYTLGGRATHWLGNHFRIGATAQKEATDTADQDLIGVDALLRHSAGTYLKAEFAQTKGPGFGQSNSTDGGFNFDRLLTTGVANISSDAYRFETALDFADLGQGEGNATAYFDHQDAGFSGNGRLLGSEIDRWGFHLNSAIAEATNIAIKYDEIDAGTTGSTRAIYGDVSHKFNDDWSASLGVRHDERQITSTAQNTGVDGSRTDGSLQIDYKKDADWSVYAFAQATLDKDDSRTGNNRAGVGGSFKLNDRLSLNGEVSGGDGSLGANAQATFTRSDSSEYYLGYALSSDRSDTGFATESQSLANFGTLTLGARTRYNDNLSVYGEERFGFGQDQRALTHVYGLTYSPTDMWTLGASIENGQVEDVTGGNFGRTAFTLSAGRASENFRFASNLEARFEENSDNGNTRDRTTWLMRNTAAYDANENWEILGRINFAVSESDQSDFLDADFFEGVVAGAYRPIENDRLNALLKYTYFEDLAPAGQISAGGTINTARQRSQILSVDAIYDITNKFSLGGKYGFRSGEVALDRTADDFIKSDAHIGVIRLDYHVISKWDLLAEGRVLSSKLADDKQLGALFGLYRHLGQNAKVGVGYNFAEFSDDLTDFDHDSDGFFLNLLGKF